MPSTAMTIKLPRLKLLMEPQIRKKLARRVFHKHLILLYFHLQPRFTYVNDLRPDDDAFMLLSALFLYLGFALSILRALITSFFWACRCTHGLIVFTSQRNSVYKRNYIERRSTGCCLHSLHIRHIESIFIFFPLAPYNIPSCGFHQMMVA
jgi:hypothetical protein